MKHCKHCSNETSYYVKTRFYGSGVVYYNFDQSQADNSEMHEGLRYESGKYAYCSVCEKRIGKVNELGEFIE